MMWWVTCWETRSPPRSCCGIEKTIRMSKGFMVGHKRPSPPDERNKVRMNALLSRQRGTRRIPYPIYYSEWRVSNHRRDRRLPTSKGVFAEEAVTVGMGWWSL